MAILMAMHSRFVRGSFVDWLHCGTRLSDNAGCLNLRYNFDTGCPAHQKTPRLFDGCGCYRCGCSDCTKGSLGRWATQISLGNGGMRTLHNIPNAIACYLFRRGAFFGWLDTRNPAPRQWFSPLRISADLNDYHGWFRPLLDRQRFLAKDWLFSVTLGFFPAHFPFNAVLARQLA